jgi:rRNA-processing protein FCF1
MTQYYYLLDTNILSEPLKPKANTNVVNRLLQQAEHITTAAPVIYEIVKGAKSKRRVGRAIAKPTISKWCHFVPTHPTYFGLKKNTFNSIKPE